MTDADYFTRRAEEEVRLAQRATHPAGVAAHYSLSKAYLDRLHPDQKDNRHDRGSGSRRA